MPNKPRSVRIIVHGKFGPEHREQHRVLVDNTPTSILEFIKALRLDPVQIEVVSDDGTHLNHEDKVCAGSVLNFLVRPGEPLTILAILSLVLTIVSITLSFLLKPELGSEVEAESTKEARLLSGTRNESKPFGQLPISYGERVRMVPPLAAPFRTDPSSELEPVTHRPRKNTVSGLVAWGPSGDLVIEDVRLGDTPFSSFGGSEISHFVSDGSDISGVQNVQEIDPAVTFPISFPTFEKLSSGLFGEARVPWPGVDRAIRTSALGAEKLQLDFLFPNGLLRISDSGRKNSRAMIVQYRLRPHGGTFAVPNTETFGNLSWWRNPDGLARNPLTGEVVSSVVPVETPISTWVGRAFSGESSQARIESIIIDLQDPAVRTLWSLGDATQVDIEVHAGPLPWSSISVPSNFTVEQGGNGGDVLLSTGDVKWISMKSFLKGPAVKASNVALSSFTLKATDQLNGNPDNLNALVSRPVRRIEWVDGTPQLGSSIQTSNPAFIALDILSNFEVNKLAVTESRLDLNEFYIWSDFCYEKDLTFRGVLQDVSVYQGISEVARAGRAKINLTAPKIYPIVNKPLTEFDRIITSRNAKVTSSSSFSTQAPLHAIRIPFQNSENDEFFVDEARIFMDGYNEETAEVWETLEVPTGVTKPDQVRRTAILENIVERQHRAEQFSITMPAEGLLVRAGDAIRLAHPRLGISQLNARVVDVAASGPIRLFSTDAPLRLSSPESQPVADNGNLTFDLSPLSTGNHYSFYLAADAPEGSIAPGEIISVGAGTRASIDCLVKTWQMQGPNLVQLVGVPLANQALEDVDTFYLPTYVPAITPLPTGPRQPAPPRIHTIQIGDDTISVAWTMGMSGSGQWAPTTGFAVTIEQRGIDGPLTDTSAVVGLDQSIFSTLRESACTEVTARVTAINGFFQTTNMVELTQSAFDQGLATPQNLKYTVNPEGILIFTWDPADGATSLFRFEYEVQGSPVVSAITLRPWFEIRNPSSGNYRVEVRATSFNRVSDSAIIEEYINILPAESPMPPNGVTGIFNDNDLIISWRDTSRAELFDPLTNREGLPVPQLLRYEVQFARPKTFANNGVVYEETPVYNWAGGGRLRAVGVDPFQINTVDTQAIFTHETNQSLSRLLRILTGDNPKAMRKLIIKVRTRDIHDRVSEWSSVEVNNPLPDFINPEVEAQGTDTFWRVKKTVVRDLPGNAKRVALFQATTESALTTLKNRGAPSAVVLADDYPSWDAWRDALNAGFLTPKPTGAGSTWWVSLGVSDDFSNDWTFSITEAASA